MVHIEHTSRIDDSTGRKISRFTPVLNPIPMGSGSIRFACYEAWSDDVAGCNDAETKALANVKTVLELFAKELG